MKERISGLAFHCHHDVLVEFVYDYDERVKYIKEYKSVEEQKLRLRLFQMIPPDRLPQNGLEAYDKAGEAYDKAIEACYKAKEAFYKAIEAYDKAKEACYKAIEAYDKAIEAYDKAKEAYDKAKEAYDKAKEAYDKAKEACYKAIEAYDKAKEAYDKALEAYFNENRIALEELHAELCPNCPWNGKTIFPKEQ